MGKKIKILTLSSRLYLTKHNGKTVQWIAENDAQYLLWLQQSHFGLRLGKSVLEKLGVWNSYKDTPHGKDPRVLSN